MEKEAASTMRSIRPGLASSYVGLVLPIVVGAALGLGIYFFMASKNQGPGQGTVTPDRLCVCPSCGMTIPKPAGLDCEEINCPNCGNAMNNAARLAAAGTMTQNRRETLAEQGIVAPGPVTQNQRETLAEQGITTTPLNSQAPLAAAFMQPLLEELRCVCPVCGKTIDHPQGVPCSNVRCPNCQSVMTNSIPVGGQQDMRLVGMGGQGAAGSTGVAPCPGMGGGIQGGGGGAPCPGMGSVNQGAGGAAPCPSVPQTDTQAVTYSNTVQGIIQRNCLRCHGGPIRTMNTYSQVKTYADNGLLLMMTQPGGPMSRFLSADESHQISAWIKGGAQP